MSLDSKKTYIIDQIPRVSKDVRLEIGKYILIYEGKAALTQCANSVAVNLDTVAETTINNVYAMTYNAIN